MIVPVRRLSARLACGLALLPAGCGAMLNGVQSDITLVRTSPDVLYVVDGAKVPKADTHVRLMNNQSHHIVAFLPDGHSAAMNLGSAVGAGGIVLDLLWCITIVGVAAPISDLTMGTFLYLSPDTITLDPNRPPETWADLSFDPALLPRPGADAARAKGGTTLKR
jgi:hypothetical protein